MSDIYIKNWFSNMVPFDEGLVVDGIEYKSVENYYQAMKLHDHDRVGRMYIASLPPRKSKIEIRKMNVRSLSTEQRLSNMRFALRHKFRLNTNQGKILLNTGDEEITEYNNWGDEFFGVNVENGRGENHLGKLLMEIRNELKMQKMLNESSES